MITNTITLERAGYPGPLCSPGAMNRNRDGKKEEEKEEEPEEEAQKEYELTSNAITITQEGRPGHASKPAK